MLGWFTALVGLFLVMSLFSNKSGWRTFWAWLALYAAGHACFLHLIHAGAVIKLQLFFDWSVILRTHRVAYLIGILLQCCVVAWGTRRLFPGFGKIIPGWLKPRSAAAMLLLFGFAAVTIPPELVQSFLQGGFPRKAAAHSLKVVFCLLAEATALLNLWLAISAIPPGLLQRITSRVRRSLNANWFSPATALWVVVVSSSLAWFALDRIPHVPDEGAYLFHAKYLATGKLTLAAPPVPEAFDVPFRYSDGARWFITPPAGWPMVLALGFLIGAPWLVNPLLGGIAILLTHRLLRDRLGRELASAVSLLLCLSPWFLFMSASLMTHPLVLVLFLLTLLGVQRVRESGNLLGAIVAGLSVGAMLHIRPLDAVLAALFTGGWWLSAGIRRLRPLAIAATGLAGLAMTALFLLYNKTLTGNPLVVPINLYVESRMAPGINRLGFGKDIGNFGWTALDPLPGHGPIDVIVNTNHNLYMVNFDLFGWAFGSLLFVGLLFVWKEWRRDALWWWSILLTVCGLNLYWFSGVPDFGARYWYVLIVPLAVLTARGAQRLTEQLRAAAAPPEAESRIWALLVVASVLGFAILVPWRCVDKYKYYRGTYPGFRDLLQDYKFDRDLIFIRGRRMPDYNSVVPFVPPGFDRDTPGPLFVLDVGPEKNEELVRYYANRRVWLVAGPREEGAKVRVLAGPLPPGTVPPAEPKP